MGIMESVQAVMWARKRQPDQVAYGIALGHAALRDLAGESDAVPFGIPAEGCMDAPSGLAHA